MWCLAGASGLGAFAAPGRAQALDVGAIRAGAAQQAFSLPRGVPLAGYSRRGGKPSRGVHDAVGVRALVLQDDETAVALVSCDLLIIDERLFAAVQERLAAQHSQPPITLLLAATHTHSGPGAYGRKFLEKISMGHFDPAVFSALVDHVTQTIRLAQARLEPVRVAYRKGSAEGLVVNRMERGGPVDDDLIVCGFYPATSPDPLAIVVSFGAHPTTLGARNMELSADYPGVVMQALEARWPSATSLFFAAAVGDQGPVKHGQPFEVTQWLGAQLAARAIALLEGATSESPSRLAARVEHSPLPPPHLRLRRLHVPRWLSRPFVDDDATLSVALIGDVVFQGVPCDLSAQLGRQLKDAAQARQLQPIVVGFANDYIGYCLSEAAYDTDSYEASMAFNGPQTGRLVVDRLVQMTTMLSSR